MCGWCRRYILRLALAFWFASLLALGQGRFQPGPQPTLTPEDVREGERLYLAQCGPCHGPRGEGGRGPTLALPRLRRAPNDVSLYQVIRRGVRGTEMPGSGLSEQQIWRVAGFVRSLGRVEHEPIPGVPEQGKRLYATKGNCVQCHTLDGQGGGTGPELSEIGARRSASYLRQALVEPEAAVPNDFLRVRVTVKDNRRLSGTRLNEDSFSIQFRDLSGKTHSFWKSELEELHKDWGKSSMPSYGAILTPEELDDLVAYLASLQGGP